MPTKAKKEPVQVASSSVTYKGVTTAITIHENEEGQQTATFEVKDKKNKRVAYKEKNKI